MTEQQLALLFKYIDVTITAAIQHEIGGETKELLELQDSFRKQLVDSVGNSQNNLCNLHKTKLQAAQDKIVQAEEARLTKTYSGSDFAGLY